MPASWTVCPAVPSSLIMLVGILLVSTSDSWAIIKWPFVEVARCHPGAGSRSRAGAACLFALIMHRDPCLFHRDLLTAP
jgi:hypothetical protein